VKLAWAAPIDRDDLNLMHDKPKSSLAFRTVTAQTPLEIPCPRNGLVWPIHFATTYTRDETNTYPSLDYVYGRADNPTLRQTESLIATLEDGDAAMLFGSGMSAAMAVILAFEEPIHILASAQMYYGLRHWFENVRRFGHSINFVDTTDLAAVKASVDARAPHLVWIETPSNPMWAITDISAVAGIVRDVGAMVCVDSTVATPVFTRPLHHGADIVMHSATKYLNGHSDVSAGALVTSRRNEFWNRIAKMRAEQGVSLGALEAWLLSRGMRTLGIRVVAQSKSAAILADRLRSHQAVSSVLYPGLPSHPGHDVAVRQMIGGFGGMFSLRLSGGAAAAVAAAGNTLLWRRATSLGGVESLIEHRSSMEGHHPSCPDDLLRLSVGIEDPEDLLNDLDQALNRVSNTRQSSAMSAAFGGHPT
jgi:cystathionine gamma-synthase